MRAIVVSIGDELILGQTLDSNAAWLSGQLASLGIVVDEHITVGDNEQLIVQRLRYAIGKADIIIVTGGLGPTADDLTRFCLAKVLDCELVYNPESMERMQTFFKKLARPMAQSNKVQAMIPEYAVAIPNHKGTADGIFVTIDQTVLFSAPGVPSEMKAMYEGFIKGELINFAGDDLAVVASRKLNAFGAGESNIGQELADMMVRGRNPLVNTTAAHSIVGIRINARAENKAVALTMLDDTEQLIRAKLGDYIFGIDDDSLASVVVSRLIDKGLTIATAESCTGGMVAQQITDIPGSSACFKSGWVTYSNEAKNEFLNVDADVIARDGAVSQEVARQLAENARKLANSDFAIGITGIAGPMGRTDEKPVGLVYIALASGDGVEVTKNIFIGNREMVRLRSAFTALNMVRLAIR
ncbi:MAG: competence/damage-inducible protein A [Phycisphaerae bacterium]|nr:competence/damage-inducible protein A [Phycisphaerae bacterium]